ncbi:precorrin-2 C(20)-methyltransferase [Chitinophaga sancti]|uniref:precorrin-2 C(20)-methyltransferase n=1 Tax=Chitinophaga sancti TaxID=1004 RepID=UPI002A757959|nr:precorrin-2 C(20)-methyltransferase [Chitinophaga sancti]WPQ61060.1 precorrin-2 C(20)-methyltransferase [Chitinophaga sancti]
MAKHGKIYGISLGPGDPLLITVKGLQVLQQVDKIYYPGSLLEDGSTISYSLGILQYHQLDERKFRGMFLKMSNNRSEVAGTYANTFLQMWEDYQMGLQVAFVSEGDISFYSTFAYLMEHIQQYKLDVEIIAGVPSFLNGAAAHQSPLGVLNEKIAILPRMQDAKQLNHLLDSFDTVVLIKVRSVIKTLLPVMHNRALRMMYCERLGTPDQFITTDIQAIKDRELPYFSLIILKKL